MPQPEVKSARLLNFKEIRPPHENAPFNPSGLLLHENSWLVVSDKKEFSHIYRLKPQDGKLWAEPFLEMKPREPLGAQDLEGLAFCDNRFLMVEERSNSVIEADLKGTVVSHAVDMLKIHAERAFAPALGTQGAGLEGIACDPAGPVYVAHERQYRMIYILDPTTFQPTDFFDVPAGWNAPRFIGTTPVYPDFADLFFENGFLYAIQRNDRLILKIDSKTKTLSAAVRLEFDESEYYDYSQPFGFAEGLALTRDKIHILLDNNDVGRRGKNGDLSPLLLEFARPKGF